MAQARTEQIDQLKEQRRRDIKHRLEEAGWNEPDWNFPDFVARKWVSLVEAPAALTDRAWQKLYPSLVPYLEKNRRSHTERSIIVRKGKRLRRMRRLLLAIRNESNLFEVEDESASEGSESGSVSTDDTTVNSHIKEEYNHDSGFDNPDPSTSIVPSLGVMLPFPPMVDLLKWPIISELLEADVGADTMQALFEESKDEIKDQIRSWGRGAERELVDILKAGRRAGSGSKDRDDNTSLAYEEPLIQLELGVPPGNTLLDHLSPSTRLLLRADSVFRVSDDIIAPLPLYFPEVFPILQDRPDGYCTFTFRKGYSGPKRGYTWDSSEVIYYPEGCIAAKALLKQLGRENAAQYELQALGARFTCGSCGDNWLRTWNEMVQHYAETIVHAGIAKKAKASIKKQVKYKNAHRLDFLFKSKINGNPLVILHSEGRAKIMSSRYRDGQRLVKCKLCKQLGIDFQSPRYAMREHVRTVHSVKPRVEHYKRTPNVRHHIKVGDPTGILSDSTEATDPGIVDKIASSYSNSGTAVFWSYHGTHSWIHPGWDRKDFSKLTSVEHNRCGLQVIAAGQASALSSIRVSSEPGLHTKDNIMILDIEPAPKSPASSGPTVRQISGPSSGRQISYAIFPDVRPSTQQENNSSGSETRPLLYQPTEPIYEDAEPPSYEEINPSSKVSVARSRFWAGCTTVIMVASLLCLTFYSYGHSKIRQPDAPGRSSPPVTTGGPIVPLPSPSPKFPRPPSIPHPPSTPPPPLPPISDLPDPRTAPFVRPTKGRTDLCRPWAYSPKPAVRLSYSDNRPMDRLVYIVPTLAPILMETSAICLTSSGTNELCREYDDSYDSVAGKLQVVGADIDLPRVEITIQHGSETGLDNTAVCLMKKPDEDGKDRWVVGLYQWIDTTTPDRDAALISMSIVVTLPWNQVHTFSTRLNYFAQTIGPEIKTDSNRLIFEKLQASLGERGSLVVRNVTAATIQTTAYGDAQLVRDTRVTKSIHMESDTGVISCLVTLVQTKDSPPVRMDIQSVIGAVSATAILEYPSRLSIPPRYNIETYSKFSPSMVLIHDPQGTNLLRQNSKNLPPALPIIRVNTTSHLSIAQVAVPATFYGNLGLVSKHAAIVTIDHAKDIPGRTVSYQPTSTGYRGAVQWAGRASRPDEIGSVSAKTEYASARLLFLGFDDDDITDWPENGDTATPDRQ
ncbi:unnamed protein product [Rhizoctonia solani]|uniref:Uncharacterized protein n=1 Tax=Rhizoctonia solani TaxID=456999 RepID=A0A8H3E5W4_9AGAM|nr:unnamed protein product [Rhizoctonia solani]